MALLVVVAAGKSDGDRIVPKNPCPFASQEGFSLMEKRSLR